MDKFKRYCCSGCDFTSGDKHIVTIHINQKNKCSNKPQLIDKPNIICLYCKEQIKNSTRVNHIGIHLKKCKMYKKEEQEEPEEPEEEQEEEIVKNIIINNGGTRNTNIINNLKFNFNINIIHNPIASYPGADIEEIFKIHFLNMFDNMLNNA